MRWLGFFFGLLWENVGRRKLGEFKFPDFKNNTPSYRVQEPHDLSLKGNADAITEFKENDMVQFWIKHIESMFK